MARIRLGALGNDFELVIRQEVKGRINKESGRFVTDGAMAELKHRIQKTTTRHFQNLGAAVKTQLKVGFPSPKRAGSRKVRAYDGEDKRVTYSTKRWLELTHPYVRKEPISSAMWTKRGFLHLAVSDDLPKGRMVTTVKKRSQKRLKKSNKMRVFYDLSFPELGGKALRELMIVPFVRADKSGAAGFSIKDLNINSSNLLAWPETVTQKDLPGKKRPGDYNRPWVAGFSELLGQRMHKAVRKL